MSSDVVPQSSHHYMHDTHNSPDTVSIEMMSRTAFFSVDDAIDPDRLLLPDGVEPVLLDDGDGKRTPEDLWSSHGAAFRTYMPPSNHSWRLQQRAVQRFNRICP